VGGGIRDGNEPLKQSFGGNAAAPGEEASINGTNQLHPQPEWKRRGAYARCWPIAQALGLCRADPAARCGGGRMRRQNRHHLARPCLPAVLWIAPPSLRWDQRPGIRDVRYAAQLGYCCEACWRWPKARHRFRWPPRKQLDVSCPPPFFQTKDHITLAAGAVVINKRDPGGRRTDRPVM